MADQTDNQTDPRTIADMNLILTQVTEKISSELSVIRNENAISAAALSKTGITGDDAVSVLSTKLANVTYGHSSLIISPAGIVTAASPAQYSSLIGKDLSYQPEVIYANLQKHPIISSVFPMEEGFSGVSVSYPIFSPDQQYLGYTDITIRPEEFLGQIITPMIEQTRYDVFIVQKDGLNVYEINEEEIGKNLLTDPLYDTPEIHKIATAIVSNQSGIVQYNFWNRYWNSVVPREAIWTTLSVDDQEWRIAVVHDLGKDTNENSSVTNTSKKGVDLNSSISEMTSFVKDAATFGGSTDQKTACDAFNNLSGPFVSGDHYIFAYDMNGTALALPYQQGLVGKNRMNLTDINGFSIMPPMIDTALHGGGYLYFVYPNPVEQYQNQLKIFFIQPVNQDWFVASGIFLPNINATIDEGNITTLIDRVKGAARHADQLGREKAISDFNDLNGTFADGGKYIFAYEYDGTTLALPYQPEIIGTDRLNYTDAYGSEIIRLEIDTAKRGGGFVYVVYYNPESTKNELKLCYVLPAGDDWLVGSGIYTGAMLEE
ncbi:MAG TPA: cache domain-containing protein [Methanospirillum sp.]|nr:cache domain-containing protein [Methanospirillum sp.]